MGKIALSAVRDCFGLACVLLAALLLRNLYQQPQPLVQPKTAKVVAIIDGDTIDVLHDDKTTERIRLEGIDTPERGQPFGNNVKQFLGDMVHGRDVRIVGDEKDRYGRTIADVFLGELRIKLALVDAGLAWHFVRYSDDADMAEWEARTRSAQHAL